MGQTRPRASLAGNAQFRDLGVSGSDPVRGGTKMTSPTDNEIIEATMRAMIEASIYSSYKQQAEHVLAAAEPYITKRAQEAVLQNMFDRTTDEDTDENTFFTVRAFIEKYALDLGITLDGDGNAE